MTRLIFKKDELALEILRIAVPAALALTADPIAPLIDTAFIGHLDEDTVGRMNTEENQDDNLKKALPKNNEMKELIKEDGTASANNSKFLVSWFCF
ncbi:hypothetical protein Sjap_000155 [Stephania japonica]|uniref:Uncharacterized protein n=1 Tax=Stephania japonica TaxID=461633 RepID=A0AAP0KIG0_9MAGN